MQSYSGHYLQTLDEGDDPDVTEFVSHIVHDGVYHGASDIHIEPWKDNCGVRLRINGELQELIYYPKDLHPKVCGRVKVMANLASHLHGVPQDGKAAPEEHEGIQLRVSIFPTVHGEKICCRVFNNKGKTYDLGSLGFDDDTHTKYLKVLNKPSGLLLLTGPTGSGKTTAIYASIFYLLDKHQNKVTIASVEDPVEVPLHWVNQAQLNIAQDFTFVAALRSLMRQDPQIIMVGEIRDVDTSSIAVQAGMTGHMVISTIHSGSTSGVFARLINMDIEPFLLASSIIGILGVRLVRVNCQYCLMEYTPDDLSMKMYPEEYLEHTHFRKGAGCEQCHDTGYAGRAAITELLVVDEEVRQAVIEKRPTREIQEIAIAAGMMTLWENGMQKVMRGECPLEEVLLVCAADLL